ncbi:MAG TPA: FecR domain-containing protein [Gemmatimonadaceae bacterium]|jgi:transmembrane sensor|nr:FecR domain-containing protein [Gemmatimonadaceae bacterium]
MGHDEGDSDDALWARLARYVGEECSPEEAAAVRAWAADDPSHEALLAELTLAWEQSRGAPTPVDVDRGWRAIAGEVAATIRPAPARTRARLTVVPPRRQVAVGTRLAIAASLVVAAGLGVVAGRARWVAADRTYVSGVGLRRTITLADGTAITLAPGSRLTVPHAYGRDGRAVELEGEGYFAVVHDARMPFIVQAGAARTTDVGTSFDVRAYASDTVVRVVVAEGRVSVRDTTEGRRTVGVAAGEMITVGARCGTIGACTVGSARPADVGVLLGWMGGLLVVRDVPLKALVPEFARWYGLQIVVRDSALRERLVTASWSAEPPAQVLSELGGLLHARVDRDGQRVRLDPLP